MMTFSVYVVAQVENGQNACFVLGKLPLGSINLWQLVNSVVSQLASHNLD